MWASDADGSLVTSAPVARARTTRHTKAIRWAEGPWGRLPWGAVAERAGWSDIRAVKERNIIEITNDDIVSRPGPRIVDGLEFLARAFHPDLFE